MAVRAKLDESELNVRYTHALSRFSTVGDWRAYFDLAEEFRALGTYKDSAQLYNRCIKAGAAPAYREIKETLEAKTEKTVEDYREAVRVLALFQEYADVREYIRVCNMRANALLYERATALVYNSDATIEDIGGAVDIFREIKTFRNCRELLERYEKYYCERVYAEASRLMREGHVYSEFDEAYELFSRILQYGDASELATACKRKADKLRPRQRAAKHKRSESEKMPGSGTGSGGTLSLTGGETDRTEKIGKEKKDGSKRADRPKDETANGFLEVWHLLDKRYLLRGCLWLAIFMADTVASVWIAKTKIQWILEHLDSLRGAVIVAAIVSAFFCLRCFLRMLTRSMRRKLAKSTAVLLQKLMSPLVRAAERLLATIGIDLHRRNRVGGRDERSIVIGTDEPRRTKKRLRNELKWVEQPDNVARVRFLFIDYMILRIRQGYFLRRTMTPSEIGREIALEEDERELFAAYQKARYAGRLANDEISAETVSRMRALNERVRIRKTREDHS